VTDEELDLVETDRLVAALSRRSSTIAVVLTLKHPGAAPNMRRLCVCGPNLELALLGAVSVLMADVQDLVRVGLSMQQRPEEPPPPPPQESAP